ncbi:MAG TPA: DUF1315 family protein [Pseudomonadales bacterium]
MDFQNLIDRLDPAIYQRLKTAVETGKWPDGRRLSEEQRALSLQAVIAYEIEHDFPEQQRTGYVDTSRSSCHADDETPLKWQH